MVRLYSYSIYVPVFLIAFGIIAFPIIDVADKLDIPWYVFFVYLPVFAVWGYILYHLKRVYYKAGELYISDLFSKNVRVIRKDRFGSVDKAYDIGTYKITYYDDDNNVKYAYFPLNNFLANGEEIIDKLNEID